VPDAWLLKAFRARQGTHADKNEQASDRSVTGPCGSRVLSVSVSSARPAAIRRRVRARNFLRRDNHNRRQEKEIQQKTSRVQTRTHPKGPHAAANIRNSIRPGTRRLLSRRSQRQMGFEHSSSHAKVPIRKRPKLQRQNRCPQPAKTRPGLRHRRRRRPQARRPSQLRSQRFIRDSASHHHLRLQRCPNSQFLALDSQASAISAAHTSWLHSLRKNAGAGFDVVAASFSWAPLTLLL
jgi:hypothetical protein